MSTEDNYMEFMSNFFSGIEPTQEPKKISDEEITDGFLQVADLIARVREIANGERQNLLNAGWDENYANAGAYTVYSQVLGVLVKGL